MGPRRWAPGLGKPLAPSSFPPTHTKRHENSKKQKRETSRFQAINEEKAGMPWHSFHLRQAVLGALAAPQRFGETKSNSCSRGAAPHGGVPVFSGAPGVPSPQPCWEIPPRAENPTAPSSAATAHRNLGTESFEDKVHPKKKTTQVICS